MRSFLFLLSLLMLLWALPALCQTQAEKMEASRLTTIHLPENTLVLTDKKSGEELFQLLRKAATALKVTEKLTENEILIWAGETYKQEKANSLRAEVVDRLKERGYAYKVLEKQTIEGTPILLFGAQSDRQRLLGFWIDTREAMLLVWAQVGEAKESEADTRAEAEEKEAELEGKDKAALVADKTVLVEGSPALTQGMIVDFQEFIEWVFETPLTRTQRETIRKEIVDSWRKKKKEDMEGVIEVQKLGAQIAALKPEERDAVRPQAQKELVKALEAQKSDEGARWLLGIYQAAHRPIAPGTPPLTRQVSDAQCEMFVFMLSQAVECALTPDAEIKDNWAKQLAASYPKMDAAARKNLQQLPIQWATLRLAWARASEKERAEVRATWAKEFSALVPVPRAQQIAMRALQKVERLLKNNAALTADQRKQGRAALQEASAALKAEGSEANQASVRTINTLLAYLQDPPPATPQNQNRPIRTERSANTAHSIAARSAALQMQHQMFMTMNRMSWENHYSRMNIIANIGNSPYRYVNAYGRPY